MEIINNLPLIMLRCLVLTILIETVLANLLKVRDKKDLLNIILANCLTNPLVVVSSLYFNLFYGILGRNISLILLESSVVLVEGIIYEKFLRYRKVNPLLLAVILNGTSFREEFSMKKLVVTVCLFILLAIPNFAFADLVAPGMRGSLYREENPYINIITGQDIFIFSAVSISIVALVAILIINRRKK